MLKLTTDKVKVLCNHLLRRQQPLSSVIRPRFTRSKQTIQVRDNRTVASGILAMLTTSINERKTSTEKHTHQRPSQHSQRVLTYNNTTD